MIGSAIDETLTSLDFSSLYKLADWHEKQSTILRSRAHQLQQDHHMHDSNARRVDFLRNTPKTVMRYLRQGHDIDRALILVSEHTGVAHKTIKQHWKLFLDDKSRHTIKRRNRLIFELHGLGLSNVNIADRLGMHAVSISRILKAEKEKRFVKNPNPERIALFSQHQADELKRQKRLVKKAL